MSGQLDRALVAYDSLLSTWGRSDPELSALVLCHKGYALIEQERYSEAIATCGRALEMADSAGNQNIAADALGALGYATWQVNGPIAAKPILEQALKRYKALNSLERQASIHYDLFNLLREQGDHTNAEKQFLNYIEITEKITIDRFAKELARSEIAFETERKERHIAEQEQALRPSPHSP